MKVIVEGPDNSGKSTLCKALATLTDRELILSGGRERSSEEILERCKNFLVQGDNIIHDRHPIISNPIYGKAVAPNTPIPANFTLELYRQKPLIIYCRVPPARGMTDHVMNERDTPDWMEDVSLRYTDLVQLYDEWALNHAHLIYRIGQPYYPISTYIRDYAI